MFNSAKDGPKPGCKRTRVGCRVNNPIPEKPLVKKHGNKPRIWTDKTMKTKRNTDLKIGTWNVLS